MNCSQVEKLISAYVDGELVEPRRESVRAHLAACGSCRQTADTLSASLEMLQSWEAVSPRLGFEAFSSRMEQSELTAHSRRQSVFPVPRWAVASMLTASVAIGAVVGTRPGTQVSAKHPTREEVAVAMDMQPLDDILDASLAYSIERHSSGGGKAGAQ